MSVSNAWCVIKIKACFLFRAELKGKTYQAQVALQLLIKPGTYQVGRHTLDKKPNDKKPDDKTHDQKKPDGQQDRKVTFQIDPRFSNDELEWSTIQRGSTNIYGLLIRLKEIKKNKNGQYLK